MKIKLLLASILLSALIVACATKGYLKIENSDKALLIDEYDKKIKVTEIPGQVKQSEDAKKAEEQSSITKISKLKASSKVKVPKATKPIKKEPSLEDDEGFLGRRPLTDPFRVGERAVYKVSYFNVVAGELNLEVRPFVLVNGKNSYHFFISIQSNSLFSKIYSVNDSAETFLDYDLMIPYNMAVHVQETKQLRELRAVFDWKKGKADFWEKRVTENGAEEKKKQWEIPPYSQNVISLPFYMRTFTMRPGKELKIRLADEHKNMIVTARVIRREKLQTAIGEFDSLVVQPEVAIEGVFQPMGEVLFWLTDDDRKFILKIESKIKIGKIVTHIKELVR